MAGRVLSPLGRITRTARAGGRLRPAPAGSSWTARTTSSRSSPTPSTRCWTGWSAPSTPSALRRQRLARAAHPAGDQPHAAGGAALRSRSASPDLQQLGKTLLATNERSEQLVEGLLLLARSDNEIVERKPVDLAEVATRAVDQTRGGGRGQGRASCAASCAPAVVQGNGVLLERIALNLVQNAVRYNVPEDGWVEVTTEPQHGPGGPGRVEHGPGGSRLRDRQPLRAVPPAAHGAHRQRQGRRASGCRSSARWRRAHGGSHHRGAPRGRRPGHAGRTCRSETVV